jgi:hypothetical protein
MNINGMPTSLLPNMSNILPVMPNLNIMNSLSGLTIPTIPNLGIITPPFPMAVRPIIPTVNSFRRTPFAESNLIDPFKTFELAVLTEEQLAVDVITDTINTILPPEMVNEILAMPDFVDYLLATGQDIMGVLGNIMNQLPSLSSLGNLLRACPIMSVINSIAGVVNAAISMGLSLVHFAEGAIIATFQFISNVASAVNSVIYNAEFMVGSVLATVGAIASVGTSILYSAALVAGVASMMIGTGISLVSTLATIGVGSVAAIVGISSMMSSSIFGAVATTVALLPLAVASSIGMAVGTIAAVGASVLVNAVAGLTNGLVVGALSTIAAVGGMAAIATYSALAAIYSPVVMASSFTNIGYYSSGQMGYISSCYSGYSAFNLNAIIQEFSQFALLDLQNFALQLSSMGIPLYLEQYGSSPYLPLVRFAQSYGSSIINIGITAVQHNASYTLPVFSQDNRAHAIQLITVLSAVGGTYAQTLTTFGLTDLNAANAELVGLISTFGETAVLTSVGSLVTALTTTSAASLIQLVDSTSSYPSKTLSSAFSAMSQLTVANIQSIVSKLSLTELVTLIHNFNITGEVLNFLIRQLTELAAKVGDVKTVSSLVSNYPNVLSNDYLKYLVTTILANYKIGADEASAGLTVSAINLTNGLSLILSTWNTTIRNNETVYDITCLLTASHDSLLTLSYSSTFADSAILQMDNVYNLPSYLAA